MTKDTLLISVEPPEVRVVQIRDEKLFDLIIERDARILNSVFKGRVADVVKGMDAAFVDIGLKRNALLYSHDIHTENSGLSKAEIFRLVKPGDEIVVQIVRPPVGNKGARVTTKISLPGRFTVLSRHNDKIGISKKIECKEERERLRKIAREIRPASHGILIRSEAAGVTETEIKRDTEHLQQILDGIFQDAASPRNHAPMRLYRDAGLLGRVVRDYLGESMAEVWIDSPEEFKLLLSLAEAITPELATRIRLYRGTRPLFERFGTNNEIKQAQERTVPIPHGGTIVIDEAEALCSIDVNTGRYTGSSALSDTVLQTNLAAAEAAARQIRLRNISGIIVIDFIEMKRSEDRKSVIQALEAALREDRRYTKIVHVSPSGLVELSRRRESLSLRHLLKRPCPYCEGDGRISSASTVAIEARRRVRQLLLSQSENTLEKTPTPVSVTLHPEAACAFLGCANEHVLQLERTAQAQVWLNAAPNFHREGIQVELFSERVFDESVAGLRLKAGKTVSLPVQSACFPAKEPRFVVVHNRLVLVENFSLFESTAGSHTRKTVDIAVTAVGRWYVSGRVIPESELQDS